MSDHHLSRQPVARAYAAMLRVLGFLGSEEKKGPPEVVQPVNDVRQKICRKCGNIFVPPAKRGRPPVKCPTCLSK